MTNVLAKKLGMKPGMKALIIGAPAGYLKSLEPLPDSVVISSSGNAAFPFVQVFATRIADVSKLARTLSNHAAPLRAGMDLVSQENIRHRDPPQPRRGLRSDGRDGMAEGV
jgi:hypothetical protein